MKLFFRLLLALFVVMLALLAALPSLFSTDSGRALLLKTLNAQQTGTLSVNALSLSWFGKQKASGITVQDGKGGPLFSIDTLELSQGLASLAWQGFNLSAVELSALQVNAEHFPVEWIEGMVTVRHPSLKGVLRAALGERLTIRIQDSSWAMESDTLHASFTPSFSQGAFLLEGPAKIELTVTPALFSALNKERIPLTLSSPSILKMDIETLQFPLNRPIAENITLSAVAEMETLSFHSLDPTFFSGVALNKPHFTIKTKALGEVAATALTTVTPFIDSASPLSSLVGENLALNVSSLIGFDRRGGVRFNDIKATAEGKALKMEMRGEASKKEIALVSPAIVQLRLSDLAISGVSLTSPSILSLTVAPTRALLEEKDPSFTLSGHFQMESLSLNVKNEALLLKDLLIPWEVNIPENRGKFGISGKTLLGSAQKEGSLHVKASFKNWLTPERGVAFNTLQTKAEMTLMDFPSAFFSLMFHNQEIDAVLGPLLNADIDLSLAEKQTGSIAATFQATQANFALSGELIEGNFRLTAPFTAQIKATPAFGKYVLRDIAPFLEGLESSDKPIALTIPKEGFHLPLSPFKVEAMRLPKATLNAEKLLLSGKGHIRTVLGLLGKEKHDRFQAWVTPIYFSMKEGVLTLERVDMLLDNVFPLAMWGTVNFPKDRVNMVVGIQGTAISKAFNISGLSSQYMLQLPLKGTINHPSLDKRKATARISALIAQTQGLEGALIGTVLEVASGSLTDEPAPPPTTSPFPWNKN